MYTCLQGPQRIINKNIQKACRGSIITTTDYCLEVKIFSKNDLEVSSSIWFIISFRIMSKHFKMYIIIDNVIDKKRINLSYPIKNFDSSKDVAIVSLFSDNIQYEFTKNWKVELKSGNKDVMEGTIYVRRELADFLREEIELTHPV